MHAFVLKIEKNHILTHVIQKSFNNCMEIVKTVKAQSYLVSLALMRS